MSADSSEIDSVTITRGDLVTEITRFHDTYDVVLTTLTMMKCGHIHRPTLAAALEFAESEGWPVPPQNGAQS